MRKSGFRPKNHLLSLAILLVLIVLTYSILSQIFKFDLPQIWKTIGTLRVSFLLLAVLALILYVLAEGRAMACVAKVFGVRIGWWKSFCYGSVDMYYSAITPSATGGQPAVSYYMNRDGIGFSVSSVVLLTTTASYILGLVVLGVAAVILDFSLVLDSIPVLVLFILGVVANLGLIGMCLLGMFCRPLVRSLVVFFINLLSKLHLCRTREERIQKLEGQLDEYGECVSLIKQHPVMLLKVFGWTLFQRICFIMISYLVYCSFGIDSSTLFDVLAIQILIAICVNSLPLPGAIGISEVVFQWLYLHIYTAELIDPAMLMTRGIGFYLCFILCGITTLVLHLLQNKKIKGAMKT